MRLGAADLKAAHVDAIQAQQRKRAREAPRGPSPMVGERLAQVERFGESLAREVAPVVEVSGHHQRRAVRHPAVNALDQGADLVAPSALVQRKVQAYNVKRLVEARKFDLAVEHPAA